MLTDSLGYLESLTNRSESHPYTSLKVFRSRYTESFVVTMTLCTRVLVEGRVGLKQVKIVTGKYRETKISM